MFKIFTALTIFAFVPHIAAATEQLVDVHIHYSHDAWDMLPPDDAVKVLRAAGLNKAFVSSSSDDGTQMLYEAAPDLIVPVLRPYRRRGELGTWFRDETVIDMLEKRLETNTYAGIGEFHIFGEDANLPVMRRVVELADQHKIFLHAHSDAEAIEFLFAQNPDARILWAHSGFDAPEKVGRMLAKYPNLTADLAFRSDQANNGQVDVEWRQLFLEFPERIMLGTDTYTPERWYFVEDNANWTREWLKDLPPEVAVKIARENAIALSNWALKK
ncbi:MAG: amidohydrolase family protein [Sneathiella sp.]|uniref:amidohydrolase family protein n=1 Tax=Sneathiella sp. TaxID=1964365 RepID=UPI00300362C3